MIDRYGFCRIAAATPPLELADAPANVSRLCEGIGDAVSAGARVVATPELGLTGYSCGDLFYQQSLLDQAEKGLADLVELTKEFPALFAVGLPVRWQQRLYNAAAVCFRGQILGVVPKTHLPSRGEFYETRWFTPAPDLCGLSISLCGTCVPFGTDLIFSPAGQENLGIGIEICEDLWAVEPPSGQMALAGCTVFLNLSASPEVLGKSVYRKNLVAQQSARTLSAYLYCSAGPGESSADLLYGGHSLVAENGNLLAESTRFSFEKQILSADVDIAFLAHERRVNSSFSGAKARRIFRNISFQIKDKNFVRTPLLRPLSPSPFVPEDASRREESCREIFAIQSTALARRFRSTGSRRAVLGLSGGLDSTLALLVCLEAFSRVSLPKKNLLAVTMPGFGTTGRTRANASALAKLLGVELREISIAAAVEGHFRDIGHPMEDHGVTFENAQARERTQILMDLANREGGLVIGTGDLSESALGWCTFNGDHMSMYHVNAGIPKTLVRYLVEWCAEEFYRGETAKILHDICDTPITPELLPLAEDGSLQQQTESVVGPYDLHDFFLFHAIRRGAEPEKISFLARQAFGERFSEEEIERWKSVFYRRFFAAQFKRNSVPDGPKVGSVALSPRGDWRMPSDASSSGWLGTNGE